MANFNRVILMGNLTRDPELSYTPSNTAVCKFGLAVNYKWTDRNTNSKREDVMFIDCTAWSKGGEIINQYCRKGRPLLIEGRLVLETWTSQEGQKRSKHSVTVENFQLLGGAPGGPGGDRGGESDYGSADAGPVQSAPQGRPAHDDPPF